ncbi:MAG: CRISPR-associated protein Cas4 [Puniceicoccaceae bacterium]|nr:MAG: CRISPR-associated protein Cas4 [Puniceicoccaceae bacterium]
MKDPHDPVPLSALQHYLYCPRQCALIHVEHLWAENRATAEGRILHERAHSGEGETRPGVRIARGLPVSSQCHGLTGVCDVVEIHRDGRIVPVEYKRGKPKAHRADEVQLCAQAICLEEVFGIPEGGIPEGFLFYGKRQRRTIVPFDTDLRSLTLSIAGEVRHLILQGTTPAAQYDSKRCDPCSLMDLCQPKAMRLKRGAAAWFSSRISSPEAF